MSNPNCLPTREELSSLPRWAMVAFAARCARRVQPLYAAVYPEAPRRHVHSVRAAVAFSAAVASVGTPAVRANYVAAVRVARAAHNAIRTGVSAYVAEAASQACYAAAMAIKNASPRVAVHARAAAAASLVAVERHPELQELESMIRLDFRVL